MTDSLTVDNNDIGSTVSYAVFYPTHINVIFIGTLEYITTDSWCGIRVGDKIQEAYIGHVYRGEVDDYGTNP